MNQVKCNVTPHYPLPAVLYITRRLPQLQSKLKPLIRYPLSEPGASPTRSVHNPVNRLAPEPTSRERRDGLQDWGAEKSRSCGLLSLEGAEAALDSLGLIFKIPLPRSTSRNRPANEDIKPAVWEYICRAISTCSAVLQVPPLLTLMLFEKARPLGGIHRTGQKHKISKYG